MDTLNAPDQIMEDASSVEVAEVLLVGEECPPLNLGLDQGKLLDDLDIFEPEEVDKAYEAIKWEKQQSSNVESLEDQLDPSSLASDCEIFEENEVGAAYEALKLENHTFNAAETETDTGEARNKDNGAQKSIPVTNALETHNDEVDYVANKVNIDGDVITKEEQDLKNNNENKMLQNFEADLAQALIPSNSDSTWEEIYDDNWDVDKIFHQSTDNENDEEDNDCIRLPVDGGLIFNAGDAFDEDWEMEEQPAKDGSCLNSSKQKSDPSVKISDDNSFADSESDTETLCGEENEQKVKNNSKKYEKSPTKKNNRKNYDSMYLSAEGAFTRENTARMVHWYVRDSTQDFMFAISHYAETVPQIKSLVESLLDLPIEFDAKTLSIVKDEIYDSIMKVSSVTIIRRAEFWREVHWKVESASKSNIPYKLIEFLLNFLESIFMKTTSDDTLELATKEQIEYYRKVGAVEQLKISENYLLDLIYDNSFRAQQTAYLAILLFPCGVLDSYSVMKYLRHFVTMSDFSSISLLIIFMQELAESLEWLYLIKDENLYNMPLSNNQKVFAHLYGKIATLADDNNSFTFGFEFPTEFCNRAKAIIQKKKKIVISLRRIKERTSSLIPTCLSQREKLEICFAAATGKDTPEIKLHKTRENMDFTMSNQSQSSSDLLGLKKKNSVPKPKRNSIRISEKKSDEKPLMPDCFNIDEELVQKFLELLTEAKINDNYY